MSDKIELLRLCGFYRAIFRALANQNRGHSRVMLELSIDFVFLTIYFSGLVYTCIVL